MKNIEYEENGLVCDNPNCDWEDRTIKWENAHKHINMPCPKCGENVLTQEDYEYGQLVEESINLINSIDFKDDIPEDGKSDMYKVSVKAHKGIQLNITKCDEIRLFLDDCRNPIEASSYVIPIENREIYKEDWITVRNYDEFTAWINKNGLPDIISFDHDLADGHYTSTVDYNKMEKTGYHCAKWLVRYCQDNNLLLPKYYTHSMNPVGSENIKNYLNNYKKHEVVKTLEKFIRDEEDISDRSGTSSSEAENSL